jgi:hypothetical protein
MPKNKFYILLTLLVIIIVYGCIEIGTKHSDIRYWLLGGWAFVVVICAIIDIRK